MQHRIGIRREDKNRWERRAPLTPADVGRLIRQTGVQVDIQPSSIRVFHDDEYAEAGARIREDLGGCGVVFGIKEMPVGFFRDGGTYLFFSHTHKGQAQNMPMLRDLMALGCQLIDYERIADEHNRRVLFFGGFAGLAGMIDSLWALGKRFEWEGVETPISQVKMAHEYASLDEAKAGIAEVGRALSASGLPSELVPLVVGVAGYGHVSQGAQEILDLLPTVEISPSELLRGAARGVTDRVVKVVFREEDTVTRRDRGTPFDLEEFFTHPERYQGTFSVYLPYLTMLVNAIYWEERYPRLVTKSDIRQLYRSGAPRLRVIGDISCDVEGSIECTLRNTDPDNPVFVYEPTEDRAVDGYEGRGPVIMAVDNLPCELARESSAYFSNVLAPYVGPIARADYERELERSGLPAELRRAAILYHGELTPPYEFMRRFVQG
jgi:alanine dehydrogenase